MGSLPGQSLLGTAWLALVASCAIAVPPGASDDDEQPTDARRDDGRAVDARPVDAAIDAPVQQTITLSQTTSQIVEPLVSVACSNNTTGFTRDNSYYRVFRLSDFGITRPFTPTMVSFGVEQATAGAGSQTVQVRLHTLSGAFTLAGLTSIAGNNVVVPNSGITTLNVPVSPAPVVPVGATLVAEVFSPDGDLVGNAFFIGANTQAESATGYIRSDACGLAQPSTYASVGFPTVRLVLTVTGTY